MARKSRKVFGSAVSTTTKTTGKIPTAIYARLSVENSGNETDETLHNQIAIVENFVLEQKDLELVDTYIDNGFTGTKFDRPDLNRLLDDVKSGKIRCIVVKDLSRFGRNYLEAGYYLETIFPLLNVRFISVNDNYDSSKFDDRNSLSVPVKNMVNAMYSKDFSHKIGVSVKQAKEERRVYGNCEAYGYKLDKSAGRLIIDREVEPYVRIIFSWSVSGISSEKIAKRLNEMNVPSPAVYYGQRTDAKWHSGTISRIVRNPVYAGFHVMNKSHKSLYEGVKYHTNDESEWIMTPNAHEAYLLEEEYEFIATRYRNHKVKRRSECVQREEERTAIPELFNGKVFCADCGRKLSFTRMCRNLDSQYSHGIYHHSFDVKPGTCTCIRIQQNLIKSTVTDKISELINSSAELTRRIKELKTSKTTDNRLATLQRKKSRLDEKLNNCVERSVEAYADCAEQKITMDEYKLIKRKLDIDKEQIQTELLEVESELNEITVRTKRLDDFANSTIPFVITPAVIDAMVERIEVNDIGEVNVIFKDIDYKDMSFISGLYGIKEFEG